ncbi:hypothetical protein SDC9_123444 [bioreactor metagenome]|uniref:Uncharacterized protein n=1 Tax=bioreactor metagenome TaxID=1076179 RepID=A0A645CHN8_9ZZZZ
MFGGAVWGISDLIEDPNLWQGKRAVEKMPVQKPQNVRIKSVEPADRTDQFLIFGKHTNILPKQFFLIVSKLVDKVNKFDRL